MAHCRPVVDDFKLNVLNNDRKKTMENDRQNKSRNSKCDAHNHNEGKDVQPWASARKNERANEWKLEQKHVYT